jgi:hypothetical protein
MKRQKPSSFGQMGAALSFLEAPNADDDNNNKPV